MSKQSRPEKTSRTAIIILAIFAVLLCLLPGGYFAGMLLSIILFLLASSHDLASTRRNLQLVTGIACVFTVVWTVIAVF